MAGSIAGFATPSRLFWGSLVGPAADSLTILPDRLFVITMGAYTIDAPGITDSWAISLNGFVIKETAIDAASPYGLASYVEVWDLTCIGGDVITVGGGVGGSSFSWFLSGYYWTPGDSGASATG